MLTSELVNLLLHDERLGRNGFEEERPLGLDHHLFLPIEIPMKLEMLITIESIVEITK